MMTRARLRFVLSWGAAAALLAFVLPRAVDVSWRGVAPLLGAVHWPTVLALVGLWFLGLWVHTFVLTAAAPSLTHRRALTLNLTGSAVSNVVPLGGAAGVELNRRMMRDWGIDGRAFAGYTFVTNLWDVGSKLLLPVVAVVALARTDQEVSTQVRTASLLGGAGFVAVAVVAGFVLANPRGPVVVGRLVERWARRVLRLVGRDRELGVAAALADVRAMSKDLVARGWLRMSGGIAGYLALQGLLLGLCLHVTGAGVPWPAVLAAFAVERALTVVPITPGGVGVADLGLVGVLLTLGGDPAAVAGAAVLYRAFVFGLEIPVGSGALGAWLLVQRRSGRRRPAERSFAVPARRVAHVTDVFLPRLGGIETHVDALARHQRARGLVADVLTPARADGTAVTDPDWVHRLTASQARRAVSGYDAVHVHVSLFSPYSVGVARAAARAGVPTLVTVHSMWRGAGGILRLAALAGVHRWPVAWSAVSGVAATTFGRSFGGVDVAVLPNAVDVAAWRPAPASARASGAAGDGVTLVSVMRLMPRKRPLQLLRMFEQVRRTSGRDDVRLVVVGDGPLRRRLERRVARRGLGEHVRITGRLSHEGVRAELSAASVYVAPAPMESFGLAVLEARCAGLPVVARRGSGVTEFVRDGVEGLLVDGDAAMVAALANLARDEGLRERLASHNRTVTPGFDWSDVLEQTSDLYLAAARARDLPATAPAVPALALEA